MDDRVVEKLMNWDSYEVYAPGIAAPPALVSRREARRAFDRLMAQKTARLEMLSRLVAANGIELSGTDEGIQDLNDWFVADVSADPERSGHLLPEWYSVVSDVALFLGDVIIERCPGLYWEFFTWGRKNVSYQRPVIMGFSIGAEQKVNLDLVRRLSAYGHRIVASRGSRAHYGTVTVRGVEIDVDAAVARESTEEIESDAFWRWVTRAESQA